VNNGKTSHGFSLPPSEVEESCAPEVEVEEEKKEEEEREEVLEDDWGACLPLVRRKEEETDEADVDCRARSSFDVNSWNWRTAGRKSPAGPFA